MPTQPPSGPPDGNALLIIGQHLGAISQQLEANSQKLDGNSQQSLSNSHKLNRLGWHQTQTTLHIADMRQSLIAALQNLKISTPTAAPPTSTASSAVTPTTVPAHTQSWWQAATHVSAWGPKVLMWLAEKILTWLAPWLVPALAGAWAMGRDRLEAAWAWVASCGHWFFG